MERPVPEDDRYVLRRVLGEGGAGRVWLAEDRDRPGAPVALKQLADPAAGRAERSAEALRREFALLYSLRHPGLAEAFDLDLDPATGLPRFSQEWIEGRTLPTRSRTRAPNRSSGWPPRHCGSRWARRHF